MKKIRTLMLDNIEHKSNGPFIAGEDMVSYRRGKEIPKGAKAYLVNGYICLNERDAMELYNELNPDDFTDL